jgi:hypothetical protein
MPERVDVSVDFGFVVPVGMKIFVDHRALSHDVFEVAFPAVAAFIRSETVEHSLIRGLLQIHVERGIDFQSALVDLIGSVFVFQVAANLFDKIRRERIGVVGQMQYERSGARVGGLRGGDLAVFQHGIDYQSPSPQGAVRIPDRRIHGRALGQTREQGRFVQSQLLGRLAEVELRRSFEAVDTVAQGNLVGIQGKNLRLGETALDLVGEHGLLHLAMKRAVGRKKKIARQLHGQSGRALHLAARFNVAIGRAHDAPEVDAGMPGDIFVFDRDQGFAQDGRKIVVTHNHAALQRERTDDPFVIVIKLGDGTGPVGLKGFDLWQVSGIDEQQSGAGACQHGDKHEQTEQHAAYDFAAADFDLWQIFVEGLHPSSDPS